MNIKIGLLMKSFKIWKYKRCCTIILNDNFFIFVGLLKTQAHPNGEGELMPSTDEPEDGCRQTEYKCFLSGIPHSMPSYHAVINPKCYVPNKLDCRFCIRCKLYVNYVQIIRRRYMAEILPIRHKTLFNQSIQLCDTLQIFYRGSA